MIETALVQQIRLALGRIPGIVLFRNNVGACTDKSGRLVRYGICNPGGADLIGWVVRELESVPYAIFLAIEVKTPIRKLTDEQHAFLRAVSRAGGIAGVARSVGDALKLVGR
jgi:hypothetical protein